MHEHHLGGQQQYHHEDGALAGDDQIANVRINNYMP